MTTTTARASATDPRGPRRTDRGAARRAWASVIGLALLSGLGCAFELADVLQPDGSAGGGDAGDGSEAGGDGEPQDGQTQDGGKMDARACTLSCTPVVLSSEASPYGLATDGADLYFTDSYGVRALPKAGGSSRPVASGGTGYATGLPNIVLGRVLGLTTVFFVRDDWGVVRVDPPNKVSVLEQPRNNERAIAFDTTRLFWLDQAGSHSIDSTGGTPRYYECQGGHGIAADDAFVYIGGFGRVSRMSKSAGIVWDGGACPGLQETKLADFQKPGNYYASLALDATRVFFVESGGMSGTGYVESVAKAGGGATVLATGIDPVGIAVDDDSVYWTDLQAAAVLRVPKAGGTAVVLAPGQNRPAGIVIDDTYVYWTNNAQSGAVLRVPKCCP